MKFTFALVAFLVFQSLAKADSLDLFGGLGLSVGLLDLSAKNSAAGTSHFRTQSTFAEGGLQFSFSSDSALILSGLIGQTSAQNQLIDESHLELGTNKFIGARAAFRYNKLVLGIGTQQSDLKIKSISLPGPGYQETQFVGMNTEAFSKLCFELEDRIRFDAGIRYLTGELKSKSADSTGVLNMTSMDFSLTLFILFN